MNSEFDKIFNKLKELLSKYDGRLKVMTDKPGRYEFTGTKPFELGGKLRPEGAYFGGAKVNKGHVGFYLMAPYVKPEFTAELAPELVKLLKGKSCFWIKKYDEHTFELVEDAIAKAYACYQKLGWV
jgi:hypothetical protein